jgi:hypothetical protein
MLRGGPLQLGARPTEFHIQAGDRIQRLFEEMFAPPAGVQIFPLEILALGLPPG